MTKNKKNALFFVGLFLVLCTILFITTVIAYKQGPSYDPNRPFIEGPKENTKKGPTPGQVLVGYLILRNMGYFKAR